MQKKSKFNLVFNKFLTHRFYNDKICRDKNTAIVLPSFKLLEKANGHFFTIKFIKVLGAIKVC
jgi:hypothetical protein